jgi:predicted nucleotidyltransferase
LEQRIQDELKMLTKIIINTVPVRRILLFGSYARNEQRADSDLDIFVVMPTETEIREIDAMILIRRAIRNLKSMPVDIVVSKENGFNQRIATHAFEQEVVREGMVLYG